MCIIILTSHLFSYCTEGAESQRLGPLGAGTPDSAGPGGSPVFIMAKREKLSHGLANFRPIAMTSSTPARCQEHLFCTRLKLAHTTATWCYFLLDHSNAKLFTNTFCATNMELPIVGSTNLDPNCSKQNTNIAWFFGWNRRLSMLKVSGWSRCARSSLVVGGMGHKASLDLHNDMVGFVETKHGL